MNNKLIADIERNRKRNYLLGHVVPELERLVKNSGTFTKVESIDSLNKIKDKLVLLNEELKNTYVMAKRMRRELGECCIHEVLIKRDNYYECAICGECFKFENIDFNAFLVECLEPDYYLYNIILSDVISDIAINGKDIFDVFEDMLYERYKAHNNIDNLLVYRRSR